MLRHGHAGLRSGGSLWPPRLLPLSQTARPFTLWRCMQRSLQQRLPVRAGGSLYYCLHSPCKTAVKTRDDVG